MGGSSWTQLTKAVQGFKAELVQNSANGTKAAHHPMPPMPWLLLKTGDSDLVQLGRACGKLRVVTSGRPVLYRKKNIFDGWFHRRFQPQVAGQTHRAVSDMEELQNHRCGGRTSFSAAFAACHQVMRSSPPESGEFILFFTEPWWSFFWVCYVGIQENGSLKNIEKLDSQKVRMAHWYPVFLIVCNSFVWSFE